MNWIESYFIIKGKRYYYHYHPYMGFTKIMNNKRKELTRVPKEFWIKAHKLSNSG